MLVFHTPTNVAPWGAPHPVLDVVDRTLERNGSRAVDLPWTQFETEAHDDQHFTWQGFVHFATALAHAVGPRLPANATLFVLSDSTVAHKDGRARRRSAFLEDEFFRSYNLHATVDAVCGSGFCNGARDLQHFRPRLLARTRKAAPPDAVLFVGGWNDRDYAASDVEQAILGCFKTLSSASSRSMDYSAIHRK